MSDRLVIHQVLPGLLHPGLGGWRVDGGDACEGFRLDCVSGGPVDLKSIRLEGADPDAVGALTVVSHGRSARWTREAASGFRGVDGEPGWELRFERPGPARLWLLAQTGGRARASYDLRVSVLGEGGRVATNDDVDTLLERLAALEARAERLTEAADALGDLVETARRAIDGDTVPNASGRRIAVLGRLAEQARFLAGAELTDFLERAGPVAPALIDKSAAAMEAEEAHASLDGAGLAFAEVVLRRGAVRRPMLSEFRLLLEPPGAMDRVEAAVTELFVRAGGEERLAPILFRKHTLSGSRLRAEPERHLDAMAEIVAILGAAGYPTALAYGTLLGAVRDGDFIAHDDDLDLMTALPDGADRTPDHMRAIAELLTAEGLQVRSFGTEGLPIVQAGRENGPAVDIFPVGPRGAEVAVYMEKLKARRVAKDIVLPFRPLTFLGRTFLGLADNDAFLAERYGADWRTPVRWTSRAGAP